MKPIARSFLALSLATVAVGAPLAAPASAELMIIKDKPVIVPDQRNGLINSIVSFIIPGVGEMMNGDTLAGVLILGTNVGLGLAQVSTRDPSMATTLTAARLGLNIGSCIGTAFRATDLNKKREQIITIHYSDLDPKARDEMIRELEK
ncbi:MAG: hypothetical protein ACK46X_09955 [Candidatus Sericytochromatia bacterium]